MRDSLGIPRLRYFREDPSLLVLVVVQLFVLTDEKTVTQAGDVVRDVDRRKEFFAKIVAYVA